MYDKDKLITEFKQDISDRSDEIDPSKEHDWFSLTLGWAVGKGLSIHDAYDFSTYMRYNTHLA